MASENIAVDIGSTFIKVMVGNKQKVRLCDRLETPEGSVSEDKIIDNGAISRVLLEYLRKNNVKSKDISFVVHGQDIIVRHTETPIIDDEGVRNSVEWEIKQYLPESGQNHYISYEIIDKAVSVEKKIYKILAVAAPREKVDNYIVLAESMKMNLKAIDIASNCIGRTFRELVVKKFINSVGVIDIGSSTISIVVLDKGKLFIEREVPFGIDAILDDIVKKNGVSYEEAYKQLLSNFSFDNSMEPSELSKKILYLFNNVFSSFEKIIEFYTTGKQEKSLDQIYVMGGANAIGGLDKYISNYLESPVTLVDDISKLFLKIQLPKDCDIKFYIGTLGLLLRKE